MKKILSLFFILFLFLGCDAQDVTGLAREEIEEIVEEEVEEILSEPEMPPSEPIVPDYSTAVYCLQGIMSSEPDSFQAGTELVRINGVTYPDEFFQFALDPLTVLMMIKVDQADSWFWYNDNLIKYFGIDHGCMSRDELIQMAIMLERHPAENWVELKAVYNP